MKKPEDAFIDLVIELLIVAMAVGAFVLAMALFDMWL